MLGCAVAFAPFGCSRLDPDPAPAPSPLEEDPQATALVRHHRDASALENAQAHQGDPLDAGAGDASDGRVEHELELLADAGRLCGSRFLPDCPLQGWMKQHANPLFTFGEVSSIGEMFDQVAKLLPPDYLSDGGPVYVNWVSIAEDGARTARMGNLNAAKASCRECHRQYRDRYHALERARAIPDAGAVPLRTP